MWFATAQHPPGKAAIGRGSALPAPHRRILGQWVRRVCVLAQIEVLPIELGRRFSAAHGLLTPAEPVERRWEVAQGRAVDEEDIADLTFSADAEIELVDGFRMVSGP